jgi:hypothetical protein
MSHILSSDECPYADFNPWRTSPFLLDLAIFVTVAEKNLIVLDNLSNSGLAVRWL